VTGLRACHSRCPHCSPRTARECGNSGGFSHSRVRARARARELTFWVKFPRAGAGFPPFSRPTSLGTTMPTSYLETLSEGYTTFVMPNLEVLWVRHVLPVLKAHYGKHAHVNWRDPALVSASRFCLKSLAWILSGMSNAAEFKTFCNTLHVYSHLAVAEKDNVHLGFVPEAVLPTKKFFSSLANEKTWCLSGFGLQMVSVLIFQYN
jgi:hypothetical protein